jgi:hypothetical protein
MAEQLDNILEWADLRTQFKQQRELLELTFHDACVLAHNGGQFDITPEFLAGLQLRNQNNNTIWVLDRNHVPVQILDVDDFIAQAVTTYNLAAEWFGTEYTKLRRQRSVKAMVQL